MEWETKYSTVLKQFWNGSGTVLKQKKAYSTVLEKTNRIFGKID